MYCTHCGAEYKKSWRMPSRCRSCGTEVAYQPRGRLSLLLVLSMAIGALVGWLTLAIFNAIDPTGGDINTFGRFLAPLLAVLAIIATYAFIGRLFFLKGFLKTEDVSIDKPAQVEVASPRSSQRLTTAQQIALNLSKVDLTGEKKQATTASDEGLGSSSSAGSSTQGTPSVASTGASGSAHGTHRGVRTPLTDALYATRKATEEQYAGESHATQLVSEAREELLQREAGTKRAQTPESVNAPSGQSAAAGASSLNDVMKTPATSSNQQSLSRTNLPVMSRGGHVGTYDEVRASDAQGIREMGELSSAIVKEHFDPIIGAEQNDYMIARFNTAEAIGDQLANHGYRYFFVCDPEASASANAHDRHIGFMAFYPREVSSPTGGPTDGSRELYLSKFYLLASKRGQGLSHDMCRFVVDHARALGCNRVVLNVNRNNYQAILAYEHLGFRKVREEKNDIGNGYYMDDLAYELPVA